MWQKKFLNYFYLTYQELYMWQNVAEKNFKLLLFDLSGIGYVAECGRINFKLLLFDLSGIHENQI